MANKPNNPWIEKKKELLKDTAVLRTRQAPNPKTGLFTETEEYYDRRPEKYLNALLTNQHRYVARREREGSLIEGLNYERMAKRVAEGTVVKELLATQPMKTNDGKVYYFQYTTKETAVNFPGLEGVEGRMLSLEVLSADVKVKTEKLRTGIAQNVVPQLMEKHTSSDIADELESVLASVIVSELDSRYLNKIINIATKHPDYDGSKDVKPAFMGDRFSEIGFTMNRICSDIARKTRRGHGNWILCSPLIVSILQASSRGVFAPTPVGGFKGPNTTMLIGKWNGVVDVYSYLPRHALDADKDTIIIGYKGHGGEVDGGLFYCPHTLITHTRKRKVKGELYLPFGSKETSFAVPNACDYYATFDVTNLTFA